MKDSVLGRMNTKKLVPISETDFGTVFGKWFKGCLVSVLFDTDTGRNAIDTDTISNIIISLTYVLTWSLKF